MAEIAVFDEEYTDWIRNIKKRYQSAKIKASVSVNRELIAFYWSLGRDIVEREAEKKYGSGFYSKLSKDLTTEFENSRGFSGRNLRYMARFFRLYRVSPNLPQVVANLDFTDLFSVPWGHHRLIIDRYKGDSNKATHATCSC